MAGEIESSGGDSRPLWSHLRALFLTRSRVLATVVVDGVFLVGVTNLAQVLQEPTLMGAYEGAGVTVLGRGIRIPTNSNDFWGQAPAGAAETAGAFPDGSVYLTNSSANCTASTTSTSGATPKSSR